MLRLLGRALPNWAADGHPRRLSTEDGTVLRQAWGKPGTETAMDMHNEGGRPFLFHRAPLVNRVLDQTDNEIGL